MSNKTNLDHLDEAQIWDLITSYYNNHNVNDLLQKFEINIRANSLYKLFPPQTTDTNCIYCNTPMFAFYPSKSRYNGKLDNIRCKNCEHTLEEQCRCRNCTEIIKREKQIRIQRKLDEMQILFDPNKHQRINVANLDYQEKVYIGALLREGVDEELKAIKAISQFKIPYSPSSKFTDEILKVISKDKRLITIHPDSNPDSIVEIDLEEEFCRYYPFEVMWQLNLVSAAKTNNELNISLMNPKSFTRQTIEPALELWQRIALHESLEYLSYSTQISFKTEYKVGPKTIETFKDLLENYSVSKTYAIIYQAINNALRFKADRKVPTKHALNIIPNNCRNYAERAMSNNWQLKDYHRPKDLPQSCTSKFLYNRILKVGDAGFYSTPKMDLLLAKLEQ